MNLISLNFFCFTIFAMFLMRSLDGLVDKRYVIFIINFVFVASYFASLRSFIPVLFFVLTGYFLCFFIQYVNLRYMLSCVIAFMVFMFAWIKQYSLVINISPVFHHSKILVAVGLSYILFRIIHIFVDFKQGAIERPGFLSYINYCFFFTNFVSGPIQRFQDFELQEKSVSRKINVIDFHIAVNRIFIGIFLMLVVSYMASKLGASLQGLYYEELKTKPHIFAASWHLALASVLYLINIYANFSGYMHIVIGVGKLCGVDVPENFNKPYQAKNFLDLWARWHITLSDWFKLYLFNPLLKLFATKWQAPWVIPYVGSFAFFVTFLVMGIWHGTSYVFIIYGVALGSAATINKTWQILLMKKIGKIKYKSLQDNFIYFQCSRALTLCCFALSLMCFWIDSANILSVRTNVTLASIFISLPLIFLIVLILCFIAEKAMLFLNKFLKPIDGTKVNMYMIARSALAFAFVIYIIMISGGSAPEFIYKAF